jgi:glycerol-3-phosphate acyltransferase PlsX
MGGDFAPNSEVLGAIDAAKEKPDTLELYLVGKESRINELLKERNAFLDNIKVVDAPDVISMEDNPTDTFKSKPNSSMNVAINLVKDKKADGAISAGNTGAFTTNSILKLGRIPGVGRPTIGALFPTDKGTALLCDVGAFVDCRANHLYEFGVMGSIYMSHIFKIDKPKIGLLNVGEEKSKGNEVTIEAYKLLDNSKLNFIGNVEGSDLLKGKSDIVLCDGFTGNILLKFGESFVWLMKSKLIHMTEEGFFKKLWVGLISKTLRNLVGGFDYQKHGGVPLLGVNGVCIVGHGKSSPLAIKNMIFRAEEMVSKEINKAIEEYLKLNPLN